MKSHLVRIALMTAVALLLAGCSAERRKAKALERAGSAFKAGEFDKAEIECLNVLQLEPENVRALEHLGLIWLERGAPLRALPYLAKIRTASPGNREIHHRVMQVALSLGKLADAKREATSLLQRLPDDKEAIVVLARAARSPADFDSLEKALKQADRGTAAYHIASAKLSLRRGDAAAAKNGLQRALSVEPSSSQVRLALAEYQSWLNHPTQAGRELKAAAELAPLRSNERILCAEFALRTGATQEAESMLKEIVEKAPDYLPAWRGLAYVAIAGKKYDEALTLLGKIFRRDPTNYEGQVTRAQLWLAQGDNKRAIDELEKLGKQFPGLTEDKFVLGQAHLRNGDPNQAITTLKQAVTQNPAHEEAVLLLGQLTLVAGDAEPVAKSMMELLANHPNLLPAQMLLIEAMRVLGRLDSVAESVRAQIRNSPETVYLHLMLGHILLQQQKSAEALKSFERAFELAPDFFPLVTKLVAIHLQERNFTTAMQLVQQQLDKTPDLAAARFMEAQVFAAEERWAEAEISVLKTLELDSESSAAYGLLENCFLAQKQSPQLMVRLDDFLEKRRDNLRTVLLGGNVYTRLKQFEKARDIYEKYLSAKPDSPILLNNLGLLYAENLAQSERGVELARQARKLDPKSPEIADTLGWILYGRKEYHESLELFKESTAKLPGNGEVHYHLGLASQKLGQNALARDAFQRALQTGGDFPGKDQIAQRMGEIGAATSETRTPAKP